MTLSIDTAELRALINQTAAEIKPIKRILRAPWTRPMAAEQKTLAVLRRKATNLCILRAFCRGKLHRPKPPRDYAGTWMPHTYHRKVAEQTADRYRLHRGGDLT